MEPTSVALFLVKMAHPTPIWRKPFAAAIDSAPCTHQLFQVAMEKVLLPPDRGGVDGTNIGAIFSQLK